MMGVMVGGFLGLVLKRTLMAVYAEKVYTSIAVTFHPCLRNNLRSTRGGNVVLSKT